MPLGDLRPQTGSPLQRLWVYGTPRYRARRQLLREHGLEYAPDKRRWYGTLQYPACLRCRNG